MRRMQFVVMILLTTQVQLNAQSVIVNEMSQGSGGGKEWVELLVVDNGVDLRGWELGDYDDGIWHAIAEFTTHADWSSVPKGTIIVIYNSGDVDANITAVGAEDTDFADRSVVIPVNNSTYVTDIGLWGGTSGVFANTDGDDCAAIRDADDIIIHDMAVTHPSATVSSPGSAKVKYYTGNTVAGITNDANWTEASSSSGTPGSGNGGDNSTWIDTSLPVELSSWSAICVDGQVRLQWTTESEIENQGFIIKRRLAGSDELIEIGSFVNNTQLLGHGSTTAINNYTFVDKNVAVGEEYFYQLSDVDYHNNITYHPEIAIQVSDVGHDLKPKSINLHSAYPNPFNPEVNLSFSLTAETGYIFLDVLDLQGVLVRSIINGHYHDGNHDFVWDGTDEMGRQTPAGVYLVRLISGFEVQTQRITLLK